MSRISFQKRQKEMKRQEKQRMKMEKRAQRKLSKNGEAAALLQIGSLEPASDGATNPIETEKP